MPPGSAIVGRRPTTRLCLALAVLTGVGDAVALPRLHAVRGPRPAIVTADGRQVLLRGVNVQQLGDYHQQDPAVAPTFPLTRADFAAIRRLGMNVVRLVVSWSALEPARGAFDAAYVARIRRAVAWARANGIYVVLDMHQDAWGKFIATPPAESCAAPSLPQHGWDGAPAWATLTDGASTCFTGSRSGSEAVRTAFQSFYDDREGIQSALVRTWGRLAAVFAAEPAVAGYDLFNEPNPGHGAPATITDSLARFYARATATIRAAERSARGGFAHVVFFEPGIRVARGVLPEPALIPDRNVVFAPHIYAGSLSPVPVRRGFAHARAAAARYGTTVWAGEWGFFAADPAQVEGRIRRYAREEDRHRYGGAWWVWRQSCGDVHQYPHRDAPEPLPLSPSLVRYGCPGNEPLGTPAVFRRVLARPYVRFAPGRLVTLRSDPDAPAMRVAGADRDARGSCRLEAWVPGAVRPAVSGSGISRVRARRVSGGWTVAACARGKYSLALAG